MQLRAAVLGVLLLPLCRSYHVIPSLQRVSAGAPRFDSFCDSIVGRWVRKQDERLFEVCTVDARGVTFTSEDDRTPAAYLHTSIHAWFHKHAQLDM